jgi:hypothetical protein
MAEKAASLEAILHFFLYYLLSICLRSNFISYNCVKLR